MRFTDLAEEEKNVGVGQVILKIAADYSSVDQQVQYSTEVILYYGDR